MNLYRIYRTDKIGYDEYDSAVVAAENERDALEINPSGEGPDLYHSWAEADRIKVELIGTAKDGIEKGVILASFNAG